MASLSVRGLAKDIAGRSILAGIDLDVAPGEIMCLVGESGCGKSTLLRLIAGIERPAAGEIRLDGSLLAGPHVFVEPEQRGIGLMFQDYALFPHLTVGENLAFGLARLARSEARARVGETLEQLGIAHFAPRYPHMLSGGEQQRVALARALAPRPRVLLMDEPFSNLDGRLRDAVRFETLSILRRFDITTILVTHDPEEAVMAADRVTLMRAGRIMLTGRGRDLYARPGSPYAARFFGDCNEFAGVCRAGRVATPLGLVPAGAGVTEGEEVRVFVRPGSIGLSGAGAGIAGRVVEHWFRGEVEQFGIEVDGSAKLVVVRAPGPVDLAPGDHCRLAVDVARVIVFKACDNICDSRTEPWLTAAGA
ncbi:ABC transporter ATP-binding protein [Chelatococcus reniformis]|uniref:Iron ABC transporter ATP-binding protein n=1 Tax=Chelatococcus reniformis TaxID=1494448 RepID=A0A916XN08_9HYPH|nr:ABC transporter ATP-binding protein [Chelatococcus reniformis]GGC85218.1 iron ABC transporter ATP-binding protein [Chelatococcus reniformis]